MLTDSDGECQPGPEVPAPSLMVTSGRISTVSFIAYGVCTHEGQTTPRPDHRPASGRRRAARRRASSSPTLPRKSPSRARSSPPARARRRTTARCSRSTSRPGTPSSSARYSGQDIKIDGEEYLIMREDEVLAVLEAPSKSALKESLHGKADCLRRELAASDSPRRERPGRRGQGHARPQGTQRRPRQEVRLPDDHQGRRHRRQGDRAEGSAREHGRADGARSRQQDVGHRR